MKRLVPLLTLLLLLTGCGAKDPPQTQEAPPTPAVTEEALRAEYEAQDFIVREIVPYEDDFLVYTGTEPNNGQFAWIYGETGEACFLLFSTRSILSYQIIGTGEIQVIQGPDNVFNAQQSFPTVLRAYAARRLDESGQPYPEEWQAGNSVESTYWAPISEGHTFGWPHGPTALVDLRISAGGLEAVFGPVEANSDFFADASSIPLTDTAFDEETRTLTLIFHDTALTSGESITYEDPTEQTYHDQFVQAYGLPTAFPAGPLADTNSFLSAAEVREDGGSVQVILTLTERAQTYTAENGQLFRDESRPYLRLSFREAY